MSKKGTAKKMFSKILGRIEILRRLDLRSMVGKYYQHALTILICNMINQRSAEIRL